MDIAHMIDEKVKFMTALAFNFVLKPTNTCEDGAQDNKPLCGWAHTWGG